MHKNNKVEFLFVCVIVAKISYSLGKLVFAEALESDRPVPVNPSLSIHSFCELGQVTLCL